MSNRDRLRSSPVGRAVGTWLLGSAVALTAAGHAPGQQQEPPATAPAADGIPIQMTDTLLAVPGVQPGMTRQELLDLAAKASTDKNWKPGETILFEIIKQDPNAVGALAALGALYEQWAAEMRADVSNPQAENNAKAIEQNLIKTYLRAAPKMQEQKRLRTAEAMFRRVLDYDAKNPEALLGLARILADTERTMLAIERFRQFTSTQQGSADMRSQAHVELGRVYAKAGLKRQAIEALEQARALNPDDPESANELARVHLEAGQITDALAAAEIAISKGRGNPKYIDTRALIRLVGNDLEAAAADAKQAVSLARDQIKTRPSDQALAAAWANYLRTYIEALQRLVASPDASVDRRIELADAMLELSGVNQLLGYHQIVTLLEASGDALRDNVGLLERLAEGLLAVRRVEDARTTCQRILELEPGNAVAKRVLDTLAAEAAGQAAGQADAKRP